MRNNAETSFLLSYGTAFSPCQMLHICHRLFDTPASITYCVLDQMPSSPHHFNSSQSQIYVCIATQKYRLTNPTKYSEVYDTSVGLCSRSRQGFHKFLGVEIFQREVNPAAEKSQQLWSCEDAFTFTFTYSFLIA